MDSAGSYLAVIKVVGVGGAGTNAVSRMVDAGLRGVEFIAANTDAQALATCDADIRLNIGTELTRGLGAGADPDVGFSAAQESRDEIREPSRAPTWSSSPLAKAAAPAPAPPPSSPRSPRAKSAHSPSASSPTLRLRRQPALPPGRRRHRTPPRGRRHPHHHPHDLLLQSVERRTSIVDAFAAADNILRQGVQGITDLITIPGLINLDFADVRTIMQDAGSAIMGIGESSGESRAADAANAAITSPLLEESIDGATGILFNITAGRELGLFEVNEAAEIVHGAADPNATIIFGAVIDESLGDDVRVTVIATGFDHDRRRAAQRGSDVFGGSTRRPTRDTREPRRSSRDTGRSDTGLREPRDRRPTIDSSTRSSLEISDDEIDIPPFLK